jgi:uncharacterized protein (TIGR02246 family)
MTTTQTAPARDEAQLRQLIAEQLNADCAKDLDRVMSLYAPDFVVFDVKPPLQLRGADAFRRMWEACMPCFPDGFRAETRDLSVTVGGDLAFAHWFWRPTGAQVDHPAAQTWLRCTAGYRKARGRWQIVHEHVSVPFDPQTGHAVFTLEP